MHSHCLKGEAKQEAVTAAETKSATPILEEREGDASSGVALFVLIGDRREAVQFPEGMVFAFSNERNEIHLLIRQLNHS